VTLRVRPIVLGLSDIFVPGYPWGISTGTHFSGTSGSKVTTYPPRPSGVVAPDKSNSSPKFYAVGKFASDLKMRLLERKLCE